MLVRYRFLEDDEYKGIGIAYEGYDEMPGEPVMHTSFIHGRLEGTYALKHRLDELNIEDIPEYLRSDTIHWTEIKEIEFDDAEAYTEEFDWTPDDLLISERKKNYQEQ